MPFRAFLVATFCALLVVTGLALFVLRSRPLAPGDTPAAAPAAQPSAEASAPPAGSTPDEAAPARSERASAAATEVAAPVPEPAAPTLGTLNIDADVPGAQVFLDRAFIGTAPVTAANVPPGPHQINVSAEGFDGIAETIEVAPGEQEVMMRLREVRLDASIAVVHRHRFGSCAGRLSATPQGLSYDTPDTGDAFSVALSDLESFEVDYLQKNLRVKVRGGRQYDFADPDDNADRLFVFHRDVSRARERLAKEGRSG